MLLVRVLASVALMILFYHVIDVFGFHVRASISVLIHHPPARALALIHASISVTA
jgi:hypothetical protein